MELRAIGFVSSPLADRDTAPKQGDEGAPEATVEIAAEFEADLEALNGTPVLDLKPVMGAVGER